ncbi:MAG: DUF4439 domain-containing protein [Actinomycetota bacterium]
MSANERMPSLWSRRGLLVALAAGSVTALSGCRVQLEEGAPQVPLVPTRVPMRDEKTLLGVLEQTRSLESLAHEVGAAPTSLADRLRTVHDSQVAVVKRLLQDGGVPRSLVEASATPTSSPATSSPAASFPAASSPSVSAPAKVSGAELSSAEGSSVNDVTLADVSTAHVALIGSLLAQRTAAVALLGGTVAPAGPPDLDGADGVALLEAARSAVYGFEIVTTHIDSAGRVMAMSTLAALRARVSELETLVGPSAPPPPLGYELPFPITDSESSRRLALNLLKALLARMAAALEPAVGHANALATLVRWMGESESMASQWGAPLAAFPGLTNG